MSPYILNTPPSPLSLLTDTLTNLLLLLNSTCASSDKSNSFSIESLVTLQRAPLLILRLTVFFVLSSIALSLIQPFSSKKSSYSLIFASSLSMLFMLLSFDFSFAFICFSIFCFSFSDEPFSLSLANSSLSLANSSSSLGNFSCWRTRRFLALSISFSVGGTFPSASTVKANISFPLAKLLFPICASPSK